MITHLSYVLLTGIFESMNAQRINNPHLRKQAKKILKDEI